MVWQDLDPVGFPGEARKQSSHGNGRLSSHLA
jgi:hypothetical protein